jgi:hypothetical protein
MTIGTGAYFGHRDIGALGLLAQGHRSVMTIGTGTYFGHRDIGALGLLAQGHS